MRPTPVSPSSRSEARDTLHKALSLLVTITAFITPLTSPVGLLMAFIASVLATYLLLRDLSARRLNWDDYLMGLSVYLLALVPSVILSVDRTASLGHLVGLFLLASLSYKVHEMTRTGELNLDHLMRVMMVAYLLVVSFGVIELVFDVKVDDKFLGIISIKVGGKGSMTSTWSYPNRYANYLDLMIPLNLIWIWAVRGWQRWLWLIALALAIHQMLLTTSVGGVIGVTLAGLGMLTLWSPRYGLSLTASLALIGLALSDKLFKLVTRYGVLHQRIYGWTRDIPMMLRNRWLWGVGLSNYRQEALKVDPLDRGLTTHAHNMYLHHLAEAGLIGLLGFTFLLFETFKKGLSALSRRLDLRLLGLMGGLIALSVHGLVETIIDFVPMAVLFWLWLGLIHGLSEQIKNETET